MDIYSHLEKKPQQNPALTVQTVATLPPKNKDSKQKTSASLTLTYQTHR